MRTKAGQQGFTLIETVVAVAILVILMGFGFVALMQHQRDLKQLEMDKTAREIYVAAQNHLTMADSEGLLEGRAAAGKAGYQPEGVSGDDANYYYYFVDGRSSSDLSAGSGSVLSLMLPFGSIDETVRTGGSYVIKYDLKNAAILDVFYADRQHLSEHAFSLEDQVPLFENPGYTGANKKKDRQHYEGAIIGWYNGDDLEGREPTKWDAPTLTVENKATLTAKVWISRELFNTTNYENEVSIRLVVTGKHSGHSHLFSATLQSLDLGSATDFEKGDETDGMVWYKITLDDITQEGTHFAEVFVDDPLTTTDESLIPGEDIVLSAELYSNKILSSIARSGSKTTNSLFASTYIDKTDPANPTKTARVTNARHLENMSNAISNYDPTTLGDDAVFNFEQKADIVWRSGSFDLSEASRPDEEKEKGFIEQILYGRDQTSYDGNAINVYEYNPDASGSAASTNDNTFMPVVPAVGSVNYLTSYDGKGLKISNVAVDVDSGDAGLFGQVEAATDGTEIKDIDLVNFSVKTASGNAGALAGSMSDCEVSGVLVYNDVLDDSAMEIEGSENVGGLVGTFDDGSIEYCGASVYVKSTGTTNAAAGGLVGATSGEVDIISSYAGGHTKDGLYQKGATGQGRYNVQAKTAGGLVGSAAGTATIDTSYATNSVYGTTAGGFVGAILGGEITDSYATGAVYDANATTTASNTVGAFIGTLGGGTKLTNNTYLSVTNGSMRIVGSQEDDATSGVLDGVTAQGEKIALDVYREFAPASGNAKPYDSKLGTKFTFQTIDQIDGENDTPDRLKVHHGDWQSPETYIVNTKS